MATKSPGCPVSGAFSTADLGDRSVLEQRKRGHWSPLWAQVTAGAVGSACLPRQLWGSETQEQWHYPRMS